jgi:hypothetical protein
MPVGAGGDAIEDGNMGVGIELNYVDWHLDHVA